MSFKELNIIIFVFLIYYRPLCKSYNFLGCIPPGLKSVILIKVNTHIYYRNIKFRR